MPTDELEARLRLLESEVHSDLMVRIALVEEDVKSVKERAEGVLVSAVRENVVTRVVLVEERMRALNRLTWFVFSLLLATALGTNLQLFLLRGGR